jgi:type IV pilus assembly protein PilA
MTLGAHLRNERGFTLIEILVVILIIGVLAAIAIPQFVGQSEKAQDVDAMSMARNLRTHVESCYIETRDWAQCDSAAEVPKTGLDWAGGAQAQPGEVQVLVRPFGQDLVAFAATSKTKTMFAVIHGTSDRDISRICIVPSNAYPTGKCRKGGPLGNLGLGTW